ncbi:uncharacterized protein J4E92_004865 [Alternaria infectoria]|uniref:uncharacterized protein n=1 Tax=Alternaria infectoria TaxID=45303 RepID=UPI00221F1BEB|nr:uncharacterized protein J4E92_004865 [Alternaria infectoria]KAI4931031.1 hypothetical protein J4E92_004865 [Alternaria infectoria]
MPLLLLVHTVAAVVALEAGDAIYLSLIPSLGHHSFPVYPRDIAGNTLASRCVANNDTTGLFLPSPLSMSYYDSDLKAVLAQFHSQPDTDTRKDILKKLSDNQLSRVVIQGVKSEFEREGLEEIALVMLGVIARDSRSKLAHDSDGEIEVEVKHEDAIEDGEIVIKMEPDSDDDNGVTMLRSKRKTM